MKELVLVLKYNKRHSEIVIREEITDEEERLLGLLLADKEKIWGWKIYSLQEDEYEPYDLGWRAYITQREYFRLAEDGEDAGEKWLRRNLARIAKRGK